LFKEYAIFALPLMIVASSSPIVANIDKTMVGYFWSTNDVSIYWNAQKFAQLPDDLTAALATVLFPAFSALIAVGSISEVKRLTYLSEKYISMVIVPVCLIFVAVAHPFILLYSGGPQYSRSSGVLVYLMMWVILRAISRPYIAHFGSFNKPIYSMFLTLIYIPLNVLTNIIFIPDSIYGVRMLGMGAEGAALASLIAAVVNYGVIRYLSSRLIRTRLNFSVLKHLVAGGISACALFLFQTLVYPFTHFYDVPIFSLIGLVIYLILLYLMNEFKKSDRDFLIDTLHVGKMGRYILSEVFKK
jgi:O-antigen/teichoic acid export membrane protein